uniref:Uncharacterized protein n=1 Tax=Globodera rostochiensis TaxID=31243 RepID=A0A914I1V2_GLORO
MILNWHFLAFCLLSFHWHLIDGGTQNDVRLVEREMSKFSKLRVAPQNYEKLKHSHNNLYYGAVKALMGQLGKHLYKKLPRGEQRRLAKCLDQIENRFDLKSPAICLVESKRRLMESKRDELAFGGDTVEAKHQKGVAFVQDSSSLTVEESEQRSAGKEDRIEAVQQLEQKKKFGDRAKRTKSARLIRYGNNGRRRVPRRVEDGLEQLLKVTN